MSENTPAENVEDYIGAHFQDMNCEPGHQCFVHNKKFGQDGYDPDGDKFLTHFFTKDTKVTYAFWVDTFGELPKKHAHATEQTKPHFYLWVETTHLNPKYPTPTFSVLDAVGKVLVPDTKIEYPNDHFEFLIGSVPYRVRFEHVVEERDDALAFHFDRAPQN